MTDNTAITTANTDTTAAISTIVSAPAGATFCSIENDGTRESAAKFFAAMNNPEHRVSDYINKTIQVQDVLVEMRDITNEDTGEIVRVPRVVLLSPDGESYQATSIGIYNAIKNAYIAFGAAPWKPALNITIKQRPTKNGSMLTADIA